MNWDKFENDSQIVEYLSKLPRYKNSSFKSVINRFRFLSRLIYCHLLKVDKPLFIVLVTNNSCDFKCIYCYGNYGHRKGIPDFSTKELLKIIDELKEMGTTILTLHGGESLLRKDFGEILNYAKLKGFYVSLNSNGTFVPRRITELKCLDNLCISMDGNEESNDKNRGKGSFKKAISALEIARQHQIPIVVSATLTKDNVNDMEFLAELGKTMNFRIQYSILYNFNNIKSDLAMTDEEIRKTVKKIYDLKKKGYPIYYADTVLQNSIKWPMSFDVRFFTSKDREYTRGLGLIPCYHGKFKYQIDADGRVVTCWAHNDTDAPNVRDLGVKGALDRCRKNKDCEFCCFLANAEHNAVMNLSLRNILDMATIHILDSLKIKR